MTEHKQLRRLDTIWVTPAIYFVTICAKDRRPIMANFGTVDILRREFAAARERHGWRIGRFVVMPDHVHFFCIGDERRDASSVSRFVGAIKRATPTNGPMFTKTRFEPGLLRRRKTGRTPGRLKRSSNRGKNPRDAR